MALTRTLRPFLRAPIARRPLLTSLSKQQPLSTSTPRPRGDYGSGDGDPKGSDPQSQGASAKASTNQEHPGPAPPSAGQSTGGGPTKGTSDGDPSEKSSSSSSTPSSSSSSGGSGSSNNKGTKGAQPKILSESPPENPSEDVRKHNEDFSQRAEQAHEKVGDEQVRDDKVSKDFWSGQGGRDSEP